MNRRVLLVIWLTVVWVLLWGELSDGNVVAGLLLSAALLLAFPIGPESGLRFKLISIVRFGLYFSWQLIVSNAQVAREVLRVNLDLEEAIVAVPLRATSPIVVSFVANAITLTPGTMTVEVRPQSFGTVGGDKEPGRLLIRDGKLIPPVLLVHALRTSDGSDVRASVAKIEELAINAFGTPEDRAGTHLGSWWRKVKRGRR